ncbi:MAG TPA: hypothetical protein VIK14_08000 [Ignavibacteria bacterium]
MSYLLDLLLKQFQIEEGELSKYQPITKFLAAAVVHFPRINKKESDFLNTWFWNTLLKNRYPGAQNERIARDYALTKKHLNKEALQIMLKDNTRDFSAISHSKISDLVLIDSYYTSSGQQIYRAMLLLLKSKGAKDFYSGIKPSKGGAKEYKLEEHHIFPSNSEIGKRILNKYKNHKYNDILNNISNIALLTKETNNSRIKAKNPSIYIKSFIEEYKSSNRGLEAFYEIMEYQFIDKKMVKYLLNDEFENFIYARTQLLVKKIDDLCAI